MDKPSKRRVSSRVAARGTTTKCTQVGRVPAAEPPATPEMIEAVFAMLQHEGWRPSHSSPFVGRPQPKLKSNVKAPTKAQIAAAWELARQMGWTPLSPWFVDLVLTLQRTQYRGRNIVMTVANAMAREYPWKDGSPDNFMECEGDMLEDELDRLEEEVNSDGRGTPHG